MRRAGVCTQVNEKDSGLLSKTCKTDINGVRFLVIELF
jgi:ribosomal protein S12